MYEEEIKAQITCRELMERFGYEANNGKTLCPFHDDKSPSMQIYKDGFKCFSCDAYGDVIDLAKQLYGLDYKATKERLNLDFSLHLPLNGKRTAEEEKRQKQAEKERETARLMKNLQTELDRIYYWWLWDMVSECKEQIKAFAPRFDKEIPHPLFLSAVDDLTKYGILLDEAEKKRKLQNRKEATKLCVGEKF